MMKLIPLLRSRQPAFGIWVIVLVGLIAIPNKPTDQPQQIYLPIITSPALWIGSAELDPLPTSGDAWEKLKADADHQPMGEPDLGDQNSDVNVRVLAKALVYARTGQQRYRDEVVAALEVITLNNTEDGSDTLALGRELAAYVIAADLINLASYKPDLDAQFRQKLRTLLTKQIDTTSDQRTLVETHERRANNWGPHAGASRAAVAVYLGDTAELARTATVFHGWLGNLGTYRNFKFEQDLSWQADPQNPVAVNPRGATKEGFSIDGALPEEMRRGGPFKMPDPTPTDYPWGALQGAVVQAEILQRAGYPAWEWEERALLRAVGFLCSIGWQPNGDDEWVPWLIKAAYGESCFMPNEEAGPGKNMGWTNWTHAR